MSVIFILGSGASKAANSPSVWEITRAIREGLGVRYHTDDRYYLASPPRASLDRTEEEVQRAVAVVRCVLPLIRLQMRSAPNYEEVYFVLRQVADHLLWEFENPALLPLAREMARRWEGLSCRTNVAGDRVSLKEALLEACSYIHDVTWRLLEPVCSFGHMLSWATAVGELGEDCDAIVTLNHDELARRALVESSVEFEDGFEPPGAIRPWQPDRLDRRRPVKLIHLHGALSWFWYVREADTRRRQYLLRVAGGDLDHIVHSSRGAMILADNRPCLSIGTHNKVTTYFKQPFNELYGQVTRLLREDGAVTRIVLAGYGGADKGVNLQISDWMQAGDAREIVLVHPNPGSWLASARTHLASQWPTWGAEGRIKNISKPFEAVSCEEWLAACRG